MWLLAELEVLPVPVTFSSAAGGFPLSALVSG